MKNAIISNSLKKSNFEAQGPVDVFLFPLPSAFGLKKMQEKPINKTIELKKIQTLKQMKSPQFNINFNPIHIDSTVQNNITKNWRAHSIESINKGISKSENLFNKKVGANLFSYLCYLKKSDFNKPMVSRDKGLLNNINHISLIPNIGNKNGVLLKYQKLISYKFNHSPLGINNTVNTQYYIDIKNTSELLYYFFKSINCLISKPIYLHTSDKVIIKLFYFLSIPKKKVFKFFSIKYINSFKNK
jgi:hypothetical protein